MLFSYRVDFVHVGMPYEVFLLFHACWLCFTMNVFSFSKPGILFDFLYAWLLMDVFFCGVDFFSRRGVFLSCMLTLFHNECCFILETWDVV